MIKLTKWRAIWIVIVLTILANVALYFFTPVQPIDRNLTSLNGNVDHGSYLLRLGGCVACHTDVKNKGAFLAGGAAIETPFGSFYAPNITSHKNAGLGAWTLEEFAQAMSEGLSPSKAAYYPVFPYSFYRSMSDQDLVDLWAALQATPPSEAANKPHEISFPFSIRMAMKPWQKLFLKTEKFEPAIDRTVEWNRGNYIVNGPGHCGACHTPRNLLGALQTDRALGGSNNGPNGSSIPAINLEALKKHNWTHEDLLFGFQYSLKPDGDVMGGTMAEVVSESLEHLSGEDQSAIATYLMENN
ncbi:cytochrome c [Alphaproteobacteria bacterium]|nr:cytochrome c [Alphaproteobacteria bacterium]